MTLYAMCLRVAKLAGALSVRRRHSSSRKTMSNTQCRPFRSSNGRGSSALLVGQQNQRSDVEAHLAIDLAADFARALDHDDALQAGPIVSLL